MLPEKWCMMHCVKKCAINIKYMLVFLYFMKYYMKNILIKRGKYAGFIYTIYENAFIQKKFAWN